MDAGKGPSAESGAGMDVAAPDAPSPNSSAHVRFANWTPDAPSAGYSFCLQRPPAMTWLGPFVAQGLPFPGVSGYEDVPAGGYTAQVIPASSSDCTTGVIPPTYGLPLLADGMYLTIATLGDVMPSNGDSQMKVGAFVDDTTGTPAKLLLRAIDATPSFGYVNIGTGTGAANDFSVLFPGAPFGSAATVTANGTPIDANGYATLSPLSGAVLSAEATSGNMSNSPTASGITLGPGAVATLVLVNGESDGPPPQIMICDDAAAARGAASPCNVYSQ
jgi:hypothetical protein